MILMVDGCFWQLLWVIDNLFDNAVKFSLFGILVELIVLDGWVIVWDYGFGILLEDLGCVFDCFFCSISTRMFFGLGLGLVIVWVIVLVHGGWVIVVNYFDGGAVLMFQIVLV